MATNVTPILETLQHYRLWFEADTRTYRSQFDVIPPIHSSYTRLPSHFEREAQEFLNSENGKMTIPMASSVFSVLEFLGFCLNGPGANRSASLANTQKFYREVEPALRQWPTMRDGQVSRLVNTYRHGMAHKFFPKFGCGVGYYPYLKKRIVQVNGVDVLNVSQLIDDASTGLQYLIDSHELHASMERNYNVYLQDFEARRHH